MQPEKVEPLLIMLRDSYLKHNNLEFSPKLVYSDGFFSIFSFEGTFALQDHYNKLGFSNQFYKSYDISAFENFGTMRSELNKIKKCQNINLFDVRGLYNFVDNHHENGAPIDAVEPFDDMGDPLNPNMGCNPNHAIEKPHGVSYNFL